MKYEMIFGDERLADKFNNDGSVFIVCRGHGVYFEFESGNAGVNYVANCCSIGDSFYMRRIIKEPKQWTWEDKKAGRLPEVGSLVMVEDVEAENNIFEFAGVCAGSKRFAVKDITDGLLYFYIKEMIVPIETQEEKAQREEDEFVASITKCTSTDEYSSGYIEGLLAAYRKLKGGE